MYAHIYLKATCPHIYLPKSLQQNSNLHISPAPTAWVNIKAGRKYRAEYIADFPLPGRSFEESSGRTKSITIKHNV